MFGFANEDFNNELLLWKEEPAARVYIYFRISVHFPVFISVYVTSKAFSSPQLGKNIRVFKKPRRRRRRQQRGKSECILYIRISPYSKVIKLFFVVKTTCFSKLNTNTKLNSKQIKKFAVVVHILQTTQNLVISRCCFAVDSKEMYSRIITHVHSHCSGPGCSKAG